jgi:tetratricopeptide (TPR) repeat protein
MKVIRRLALLLLLGTSHGLFAAAPLPPPSAEQLQRLIAALGDGNYFVRQKAEADLARFGFAALDAVTAATDDDDMEVATRANRLLYLIRSDWTLSDDPPPVSQLLADYDGQEEFARQARFSQLIELPDDQGVAAVCRVIRYDRSLPLAKTAALRLVESRENDSPKSNLAAALRKGLGGCRRDPAQWVLRWLEARRDPKLLAGFWSQLAAEEEGQLFRQPRDTSAAIVESLLRFQIAALRKADPGADAARSVERLITLRRGEVDELVRLLNWLIAQEDWPATRIVENRCKAMIAESADLLYLLAEAQIGRGDTDAAKLSAARALALNPGGDETALVAHLRAGGTLQERGRFEWTVKEWEHVLQNASPRSSIGIQTAHLLSELYHDLEDDHRAAETLALCEKAFLAGSNQTTLPNQEGGNLATLGSLRARRDYFEACLWKSRGDFARQRALLDKALATECYDIEVLIESHNLPPSFQKKELGTPAYRAKIRGLIEKQLCELREQAADIGQNIAAAQPCNEFAWLVANTEGDLDEALRYAKRALELSGDRGAYVDTLARVYFAKGDYAAAVKHQARAAEEMPHNRAVQKQLVLFQKKARELGIKIEKTEKSVKAAARNGKAPWDEKPPEPPAADDDPFGK